MWNHLSDLLEKEYEVVVGGCITSGRLRYRFAIMVWSKHIDITILHNDTFRIYRCVIGLVCLVPLLTF